MATASVDIMIEGVEIRVSGLRLVRHRDQSVTVELPMTRDALGRPSPCVEFPEEIHRAIKLAITREVVDSVQEKLQT